MWARVSTFKGPTDNIDEDIRDSREAVKQLLDNASGSRGVYYLIDREHGRSMAVTLWESEEALRASEEAAAQVRDESNERVGGETVSVERYEVALEPSDVLAA
jgi:heme-degrading monooxygenase HmoA